MAVRIKESEARKLFLKNKLDPIVPFPGTQKPWKSKCLVTGKLVAPTYGKVRDFGHRCIYCSRGKVEKEEAFKLAQKRGFQPLSDFPGTNSPWKLKCKRCGNAVMPNYWSLNKNRGTGCKYCSGRKVDESIAKKNMESRGFTVLEAFPGSAEPWKVKCKNCKRIFKTYYHGAKNTKRCKYCQGTFIDKSVYEPILKKLKLKPLKKFPGAKKPWKMKCLRCERQISPTWTHLTRKDRNVGGCVYCSKRRIHKDDLLTLLSEKKLKLLGNFINGKTPLLCLCLRCKRQVYPRMNDLRSGQSGCIYCAGLKIDEKTAIQIANKNGFTPLVPYPGANIGWDCICNICGQVSKPRYTSMQQGINRCKFCATGGFDFNSSAVFYLISHKKFAAYKIGIAGATSHNERLKKHRAQGWVINNHMRFQKGIDAFDLETKVLRWLRVEKGLSPFLKVEQMPQAGWSETIDAKKISLSEIWAKVEELKGKYK